MFSLFPKKTAERSEMTRLVQEQEEWQRQRADRRMWAIEQANFTCADGSVDDVMRAARRFYREAFNEEWSE